MVKAAAANNGAIAQAKVIMGNIERELNMQGSGGGAIMTPPSACKASPRSRSSASKILESIIRPYRQFGSIEAGGATSVAKPH